MLKTEIIWHEAKDEKPERDGEYIMVTKRGKVDHILFAEGMWNAFIDGDGILHDQVAFAEDDDYVQLWAEFPAAPNMEVAE
jgi:hypothetical protein